MFISSCHMPNRFSEILVFMERLRVVIQIFVLGWTRDILEAFFIFVNKAFVFFCAFRSGYYASILSFDNRIVRIV